MLVMSDRPETDRPAIYLLIEGRLGESLPHFVAERRPHISWRRLALEIYKRTEVDVSYEALRTWFSDVERAA